MGADSKIEWTHHTFNTHWGCARVSPACENCYAETFAKRVGHGKRLPQIWGVNAERKFFGPKHWAEPLKWNRAAEKAGERHRVFCSSMADVFEDRRDLDPVRERLAGLINATPSLDWLLLTKRPEHAQRLMTFASWSAWGGEPEIGVWPSNVWLGTTVENQKYAEARIPILLSIPARVRFLSCEPLLESIDLRPWFPPHGASVPGRPDQSRIDWVIVGGESGGGARPFDIEWARSILKQCKDAGVACHVKQLGSRPVGEILALLDRKGGDWSEWPGELRVREYPEVRA